MGQLKIFKPVDGNPTQAALHEVVNTLKRAQKYWPQFEFEILGGPVEGPGHPCGTSGCFVGAYTAVLLHEGDEGLRKTLRETGYVGPINGRPILNRLLGVDINNWADKNPELWGNRFGGWVFDCDDAFREEVADYKKLPPMTLEEVIDWLENVRKRLPV